VIEGMDVKVDNEDVESLRRGPLVVVEVVVRDGGGCCKCKGSSSAPPERSVDCIATQIHTHTHINLHTHTQTHQLSHTHTLQTLTKLTHTQINQLTHTHTFMHNHQTPILFLTLTLQPPYAPPPRARRAHTCIRWADGRRHCGSR
jgi:hypothetical protein